MNQFQLQHVGKHSCNLSTRTSISVRIVVDVAPKGSLGTLQGRFRVTCTQTKVLCSCGILCHTPKTNNGKRKTIQQQSIRFRGQKNLGALAIPVIVFRKSFSSVSRKLNKLRIFTHYEAVVRVTSQHIK